MESTAEWYRLAKDQHALVRHPASHTSYMTQVADRLLNTDRIDREQWKDMMEVISSAKLWAAEAYDTYSPGWMNGGIYEIRDAQGRLAGMVEHSTFDFYNLSADHGVVRRNPQGRLEFHHRGTTLYGSVDGFQFIRLDDGQRYDLVQIGRVLKGERILCITHP